MKTLIDDQPEPIKVKVETVPNPEPPKKSGNNTAIILLILLIIVIIGIFMYQNATKK